MAVSGDLLEVEKKKERRMCKVDEKGNGDDETTQKAFHLAAVNTLLRILGRSLCPAEWTMRSGRHLFPSSE